MNLLADTVGAPLQNMRSFMPVHWEKIFNKTTFVFLVLSFKSYVKVEDCQEIKIDIGRMKWFGTALEPSLSETGFQANTMQLGDAPAQDLSHGYFLHPDYNTECQDF